MTNLKYLLGLLLLTAFVACEPEVEDKIDIGTPPTASFEIIPGDTPNDFILNNTTDGAFLTQWDLGAAGNAEGQSATANFPFKGSYEVTMTTFTKGGSGSATKTVNVTQDDPSSCNGNFELLTNCGEKVWRLAPEASALHVGPNISETWWGNSDSDVTARDCHFNDRYVFRSNGEFEQVTQGDFWADTDGNGSVTPADLGLSEGCQDEASWPDQYSSWGAGLYSFNVSANTLTVSGEGAWIGLYKVGTGAEVTSPQSSVTYNIDELTADRMVLFVNYGVGVWRFTLIPE